MASIFVVMIRSLLSQREERAVLRKVETEVLKLRDELESKGMDEVRFRMQQAMMMF